MSFHIYIDAALDSPEYWAAKLDDLTEYYRDCALSSGPARPSIAKWTPFGTCMDCYGLTLAGAVLHALVQEASAKFAKKTKDHIGEEDADKYIATKGFL